MDTEATTASPLATDADAIVIGVFEGEDVAHDVPGGGLGALLHSGEARRTFKRLAVLHAEGRRFIIVGLGERDRFDAERARIAAALAHGRAQELGAGTLCWEVPHRCDDAIVAGLVQGTLLHAYRFERYKPPEDVESDPIQHQVQRLLLSAHEDFSETTRIAGIIAGAQNRARDLGNMPGNELPPGALAVYAQMLAAGREGTGGRDGLTATVLDEGAIREQGMGAFAAVARGSLQGARLIELRYDGAGAGAPRLALVGKAVTFDSGGLSLKPAQAMEWMKADMGGAAAVLGALAAVASLGPAVNVVGWLPTAENMPSGTAIRPSDVLTMYGGKRVEVMNTDAEGRLVLADALARASEERPDLILDAATLTGAQLVALGSRTAAVMANDDDLRAAVCDAAGRAGEAVWPMPLPPELRAGLDSAVADMTNVGPREGGMLTAGLFLKEFVGEGIPWAHLDIAGPAYNQQEPWGYTPKGGTGAAVRTFVQVVEDVANGLVAAVGSGSRSAV